MKQGCPIAVLNLSSFSAALGSVPATQQSIGHNPLSGNPQTSQAKPHVAGIIFTSLICLFGYTWSMLNPSLLRVTYPSELAHIATARFMPTSRWSLYGRKVVTTLEGRVVLIEDSSVAISRSAQWERLVLHTIWPRKSQAVCIVCAGVIVACLFGVSYLQQLFPGEWRQGVTLTSLPTVDTVSLFSFSENTSTMLSPIESIVQAFYSPYSNSNEHPSQYCVSTTSQALRIRQLEKAWHLTYFRLWHYRYPVTQA